MDLSIFKSLFEEIGYSNVHIVDGYFFCKNKLGQERKFELKEHDFSGIKYQRLTARELDFMTFDNADDVMVSTFEFKDDEKGLFCKITDFYYQLTEEEKRIVE